MAAENRVLYPATVQQEHFIVAGNIEIVFQSIVHSHGTVADATSGLPETVFVLVEYNISAGLE